MHSYNAMPIVCRSVSVDHSGGCYCKSQGADGLCTTCSCSLCSKRRASPSPTRQSPPSAPCTLHELSRQRPQRRPDPGRYTRTESLPPMRPDLQALRLIVARSRKRAISLFAWGKIDRWEYKLSTYTIGTSTCADIVGLPRRVAHVASDGDGGDCQAVSRIPH